jgi:hypothetical protein
MFCCATWKDTFDRCREKSKSIALKIFSLCLIHDVTQSL